MWNKREKELAEYQLNAEEKVLKQLEHHYRMALEDVKLAIQIMQTDEQTISKIHQIKYQKTLQKQLDGILEKLHLGEYKSLKQYLTDCYTDSFIGTLYDMHGQDVPVVAPVDQQAAIKAIQLDTKLTERKIHANENGEMVALYESLGIDTDKLKQTIRSEITRGIATGMRYEDIARNISNVSKAPLSRAKTIARTEGHRIQQASAEDARQMAKAKGADVVKQWDSSLDGATRKTHRELDGQIQEVNKPFTNGTKKAMYPGDFGLPEEDCNCRCVALTRARWALNEKELKVLQERAAFFKLTEEKKQTFEDFKKKYLKVAETLKNQGENAIIEAKKEAFRKDLLDGKINTKISKQKQARHIKGSKEFDAYVQTLSKRGDFPSYIRPDLSLDDLYDMVKGKLGTGTIDIRKDDSIQEFFDCDMVVGFYYDKDSGKYRPTKRVQIKYAVGGGNIHIIPVQEH